jgi:hypothetical protein
MRETSPPPIVRPAEDPALAKLVEQFKELSARLERKALACYRQQGELLIQAREKVRGNFGKWIEANLSVTWQMADRYIKVAENWDDEVRQSGSLNAALRVIGRKRANLNRFEFDADQDDADQDDAAKPAAPRTHTPARVTDEEEPADDTDDEEPQDEPAKQPGNTQRIYTREEQQEAIEAGRRSGLPSLDECLVTSAITRAPREERLEAAKNHIKTVIDLAFKSLRKDHGRQLEEWLTRDFPRWVRSRGLSPEEREALDKLWSV